MASDLSLLVYTPEEQMPRAFGVDGIEEIPYRQNRPVEHLLAPGGTNREEKADLLGSGSP